MTSRSLKTSIHPEVSTLSLKPCHEDHIEYVSCYSSREPQHPTTVECIKRSRNYASERTDARPSESYVVTVKGEEVPSCFISFHEGAPPAEGLNGWLNEDLVAILHHRFQRHQSGPFACPQGGRIVELLEEVMNQLLERRRERQSRGVSATQKV